MGPHFRFVSQEARDNAGLAGEQEVGIRSGTTSSCGPGRKRASSSRPSTRPISQEKRRQLDLAVNLSLVSPSAAFARFIADVCGTGELERARYLEAVRAHQKALDNELFSKVKRTLMIHEGGQMSMGFSAMPVDASKLPRFSISAGDGRGDAQGERAEPRLAPRLAHRPVRLRLRQVPQIRREVTSSFADVRIRC